MLIILINNKINNNYNKAKFNKKNKAIMLFQVFCQIPKEENFLWDEKNIYKENNRLI
jgi:hypothetical protein